MALARLRSIRPCRVAFTLAAVIAFLGIYACTGYIIPPTTNPAAPAGSSGYACPLIPASIGACSDLHFVQASLSCGGTGQMLIATSTVSGGATRFAVQLQNGSAFSSHVITPDPACWIKDGAPLSFVFGVSYTGDQGLETDGTPCIVQSKAVFSQFHFNQDAFAPFQGTVEDQLHLILDRAVINAVFVAPGGMALPGRCVRWRQMP